MNARGVWFVAWAALLGCAIALSAFAAQHDTLPGDTRIMSWTQERAFPGQTLSDAVRAITTTEVVMVTGVVAAAALWLAGYRWEAGFLFVGVVLLLPLLQGSIKEVVDRPRPEAPLVVLRAGFSSPSFPAGHIMSPTLLYGLLFYVAIARPAPAAAKWLVGVVSAVIIVAAGPPNVWVGVHWPSDVAGGWAWGLVLAGGLALALETVRARRRHT